ncbi:unnamed protein product [Trichogramma brassicae]|uniref:Uncharacterized protein n=1 Tax=Trichogramma brassicae TaxID=86971 RepID=A0A6H5I019_9HYME|nr:unnamed protein product [Trichogramma brassicae]
MQLGKIPHCYFAIRATMKLLQKIRSLLLIVVVVVLLASSFVSANPRNGTHGGGASWAGYTVTCTQDDGNVRRTVSCQGARMVRSIVLRLLEEGGKRGSWRILDGVDLVQRRLNETEEGTTKRYSERKIDDKGGIGSILKFMESRELRIRLSNLFPKHFEAAVKDSLPSSMNQGRGHGDKKKGDNVMLMAMMMGKMLAALGFGALGLLAMKALMISALALMLSLIVAAKKFHSSSGHHKHLVYAQELPHHRRRRRRRRSSSGSNSSNSTTIKSNRFTRNQPYLAHVGGIIERLGDASQ